MIIDCFVKLKEKKYLRETGFLRLCHNAPWLETHGYFDFLVWVVSNWDEVPAYKPPTKVHYGTCENGLLKFLLYLETEMYVKPVWCNPSIVSEKPLIALIKRFTKHRGISCSFHLVRQHDSLLTAFIRSTFWNCTMFHSVRCFTSKYIKQCVVAYFSVKKIRYEHFEHNLTNTEEDWIETLNMVVQFSLLLNAISSPLCINIYISLYLTGTW